MTVKSTLSVLAVAAVLSVPLLARSDTPQTVKIPRAGAKFDPPATWARVNTGDWIRFKPSDELARLGFVTYDQKGVAARLGQVVDQFGLTNVTWGAVGDATVGAFPARSATSTSCTLKSGDACSLWYATMSPGGAEQLLVVYLFNTTKGAQYKATLASSVGTLRKAGGDE